jgi:hypothetical protein
MDKNKTDNNKSQGDNLSKEKTNQNIDKQKPDASLPDHNKSHQIGEDVDDQKQEKEVKAKVGSQTQNAHDGHPTHGEQNSKDGAVYNKEQEDRKSSNHNSGMPEKDHEKNENGMYDQGDELSKKGENISNKNHENEMKEQKSDSARQENKTQATNK